MGTSYEILHAFLQAFQVHLAVYLLEWKMFQTEVVDMFYDHYTFLQVLHCENN
jgi:hypothetical protein